MERKILFCGWVQCFNRWVYGSLIQNEKTGEYWIVDSEFVRWMVQPESVGEWTGAYDINNAKIFENDRCELSWKRGKLAVGTIVFQNGEFLFVTETSFAETIPHWSGSLSQIEESELQLTVIAPRTNP